MGSPLPLPEQLKSKKTPTQASFFVEQFFLRCAAADTARISPAVGVCWHEMYSLKESTMPHPDNP